MHESTRPDAPTETTDARAGKRESFGSRWHSFYGEHVEESLHAVFGHVERIIVATLVISAGAHVSSDEPAIVLFGYLRHGLVGRGVELFGGALLVLNFFDGLYRLNKLQLSAAYQVLLALGYLVLSVRLIQLILAFRGE